MGWYSLCIGGVDKITTSFIVCIEQLEAAFLVHGAHAVLRPLIADTHASQREGRDMNSSQGRETTVTSELGAWLRGEAVGCSLSRYLLGL